MNTVRRFWVATLLLSPLASAHADDGILGPAKLQAYVAQFNAGDNELYPQHVPNAEAAEFLQANVPRFECPDAEIERTYYFRWWTYRKHLKETPDGFVITEFLPLVGWASKHNTISCAAGHHVYEGRWLRDPRYLDDYTCFWLRRGTGLHRYSNWLGDATWARYCVNGNAGLPRDMLPDLVRNFRQWEQEKRDPNGLFWQVAGADGMEFGIGGTGYRATINSYMYGDARAIAAIAELAGEDELAREFVGEAARIKRLVQDKLWDADAQFFKARPRPSQPGEPEPPLADVRELYGFTPWYFSLPDQQFSGAWRQVRDPQGFDAPFGPTTAEQRHPQFKVVYRGHECQWNGPSWPYATAVTLVALANLLNNYQQDAVTKADYFRTLKCYTRSHALREKRLEIFGSADHRTSPGPQSSADQSEPRHTWWSPETLGTTQWVQYEFARPVRADAVEVYWYVDGKGCALPDSWRVQYRDGEEWREVAATAYGRDVDRYNRTEFPAVESPAFRLEATAMKGMSAGILEWQLWGGTENLAAHANPIASATDAYAGRVAGLRNTAQPQPSVVTPAEVLQPDDVALSSLDLPPWIDENLNPYTGDWIARSLLRERKQQPEERGKDYNHSTYCDLIITGLVGLRPRADDTVEVNPLIPDGWAYFCLDNIAYHGRTLTILWDQTGDRYRRGPGLLVLADGQEIARSATLSPLSGRLPQRLASP